ncbi:MAG: DNA polymerase III subunit delta' [Erythrobacter sp.]
MTSQWSNHVQPWREWREAMNGPRMHHGWILAGKQGLGKRAFAEEAARLLVAEDGVPQPSGAHPDIVTLTHLPKDDKEEKKRDEGKPFETKRNISVAQIRAMQQRLITRPTVGSRRVIIVDPADDMEASASNALLKSLEEPPKGTFFILVAHRPSRLLPTIRSRCRVMRFPLMEHGDIDRLLSELAPETGGNARDLAVQSSGGSLGAALAFIEQDLAPIASVMRKLATQGDPGFQLRGQLAKEIGPRAKRERMQAVLDLARGILAEQMGEIDAADRDALIDTHAAMVELAAQAPTFNFDPGLLVVEIGSLLARAAPASERANV